MTLSPNPAPNPAPAPAPPPEIARDTAWQRLDPRMLLVQPVRELLRFLPFVIGAFVAGSNSGGEGPIWHVLGLAVPVGLGVLRYATTTFRITDARVELRRGLLSRHTLSTRVDRVRTVDLTSSPVHRLLGLTTVRIGTGSTSTEDEERIDLDGLPLARARELSSELLRIVPSAPDSTVATHAGGPVPVLRLDPAWVRYAPLTSTGLVIGIAALGVLFQLLNLLGPSGRVDPRRLAQDAQGHPVWLLAPLGMALLVIAVSLLAVLGYLLTNFGLVLSRVDSGSGSAWHLRRGLLTTRETSLDDDRVAGVSLGEPLLLRAAGGARLTAIVTGLDKKQRGGSLLTPPAPRGVAVGVGGVVLGSAEPLEIALVGHGARGVRRRWTRALTPAVVLAGIGVAAVAAGGPSWLLLLVLALPAGTLLAHDRSRSLGHALAAGHLVARSGSLDRRRDALAIEHVIGWTVRASFFQRRAGLVSLIATTAGGRQRVTVLDIPEPDALGLVAAAMPDLLAPFLTTAAATIG